MNYERMHYAALQLIVEYGKLSRPSKLLVSVRGSDLAALCPACIEAPPRYKTKCQVYIVKEML